jgi:large subunit ribosomal protein L19
MSDLLKSVENEQINSDLSSFSIGDTVRIYFKIIEGKTERVQAFEGLCLSKSNIGTKRTFTVRKMSYGVGVERIFPLHSPRIQKIEVVRQGKVRRGKLYYIRDRVGKSAKVAEVLGKGTKKKRKLQVN